MQLTEIMALNRSGLTDEDGEHSDWIELHNSGPDAVDLRGWHLTDDPLRARRWEFPSVVIPAGGYLVVFASGKDRSSPGSQLHTDFSLAAEGEYLALTDPDGQEADEFAPRFPPQVADISWGLVPNAIQGSHAYFYAGTPEKPNDGLRASEFPVISHPGGTFTEPFTITLSSPQEGAVIYYTLDGSKPDLLTSPVYREPLPITATTRLRAIAKTPGMGESLVSGTTCIRLAQDAAGVSSSLPLMVLDNFGGGRPAVGTEAAWMIFEPGADSLRSALTSPPEVASVSFIKVRGSSTAEAGKYSLAVEARNEAGGDRDIPILGLPPDSDWVLTAPYEFDRSLIRNPLMGALSRSAGRYAPRTRQVELYLNTGGGPLTAAHYFGVYTLTERIKRGPDRVDVTEIGPLDNAPPAVSGGYLLKIDRPDPGDSGFPAAGQTLYFVDPDERDITSSQKAWLTAYMSGFRTALTAPDFFDPLTGYAKWVDSASFIDHHILNVAAKNVDAFRLSAYFFKDRLGRLTAGPVWDFDRSMDSTDGRDNNFDTWRGETGDLGTDFFRYPWYHEMFKDRNFWQRWIDRYEELRQGPLGNAAVQAIVDGMAAELTEAAPRNFQRWSDRPPRNTWAGEVSHLRSWLINRLEWMDSRFTRPPQANTPGGPVPDGFQLVLTPPALSRPEAVIYYTTDGTDPRAFDETTGQQIVTDTFITADHPVRVHLPVADIGTAWRDGSAFDDSSWWSGRQGVGFDDGSDFTSFIRFNMAPPPAERRMKGVMQSCYLRCHFDATAAQIARLTFLKLRVRCDDGMVAWLNGAKLPASINAPDPLEWNSGATTNVADAVAAQFTDFDISNPAGILKPGANVLAIHGLNRLLTSTDFLIQVELVGGYVPADAPEQAPGAKTYTGPLPVTETIHLVARTYDPAGPFDPFPYAGQGAGQTPVGSHWSAPLRLSLLRNTVPAAAGNLAVVEIMYHPARLSEAEIAAGFNDREEFEYIVLQNIGTDPVDLTGTRFISGISFTMGRGPLSILAPGARGILARNRAALLFRSGPGLSIIGEYRDKLSNAGEVLTMLTATGDPALEVPWDDGEEWPPDADGPGYSLVRIDPAAPGSSPSSWRRSLDPFGELGLPAPLTPDRWRTLHFPNGGPAAAWDADPDSDGICNSLEYALATHPLIPGSPVVPVLRLIPAPDGTPVHEVTLPVRPPGPQSWMLECCTGDVSWQPVGTAQSPAINPDGTLSLKWTVPPRDRALYRATVRWTP